jgi:hypothetical protein
MFLRIDRLQVEMPMPKDPDYNQRGTAEQYVKQGKTAVTWTRLSCMRFAANAVRLQLHAPATSPTSCAPRRCPKRSSIGR